jgi:ABC-type polysaccharide/polyol phosphate transport system ATPase subunit
LLKILAGVTTPTTGAFTVRPPVASILELGAAFHPDLTGRQNIALNAALLGLSRDQVREKTPQIVDWSEIGEFIDRPVRTYSTGMAMRLGFSIAVLVEPAVLIVDEALSVGDGYFQKKCVDRLQQFQARGGTLLFCSHALYYISAFCERALWLRQGRVAALGPTAEVVRDYEHYLVAKAAPASEEEPDRGPDATAQPAAILTVDLEGRTLRRPGEPLELRIEWRSDDAERPFHLGVGINRMDEVEVLSFATHLDGEAPIRGACKHAVRLRVPSLPLRKGEFKIYVFLLDEHGVHVFDRRILPRAFAVSTPDYGFGLFEVEHRWERS